jgi:hypothetical protein
MKPFFSSAHASAHAENKLSRSSGVILRIDIIPTIIRSYEASVTNRIQHEWNVTAIRQRCERSGSVAAMW